MPPLTMNQVNTIELFIATNEAGTLPDIDMENARKMYKEIQNQPMHTRYLIDYSSETYIMYHMYKSTDNTVYIFTSRNRINSYTDALLSYCKMEE